jgi:aryl-alcohol dehydrogenase-like predicted oxidoreductase
MEYIKLGHSPLEISRIGFGCWAIGGHGYGSVDDSVSIKAIRKALELGINFFDTANVYGFGHSESLLSEALGEERHEVVIATKVGMNWDSAGRTYRDCSPHNIVQSLEASLRRLRIDCLPLYQIHWHDGKTRMDDIMDTLARCRDSGKIRYIGCCSLPSSLMDEACAFDELVSMQALYNIKRRENEKTMENCYFSCQIGVVAYEVLGRGLFSGKYGINSRFGDRDTRSRDPQFRGNELENNLEILQALTEVGRRYSKSAAQSAIRWVLEKPFVSCALVGAKSPFQVEENAGALGWSLDQMDLRCLNRIAGERVSD